jgi:chromosome segregation ATPase
MKKTNILKLICATVIIPSISLAADNDRTDLEGVRRLKREELERTNRFTPVKENIKKKFDKPCLTEETKQRFVKGAIEKAEIEREGQIADDLNKYMEALRLEKEKEKERKRVEEARILIQLRHEEEIKKNQELLEKVQKKDTSNKEKISSLESNLSKMNNEKESLAQQKEDLELKINDVNAKDKFTEEYLQEMIEESTQKTQQIQKLEQSINILQTDREIEKSQYLSNEENLITQLGQKDKINEMLSQKLKNIAQTPPKNNTNSASVNGPTNPIVPVNNSATTKPTFSLPTMDLGKEKI